jgi:23S rRNA (adenine2030-N6)-methyltransferase
MNYRHAFHAGNFADVFKHAVLACLLKALQNKDKGFAYIETHAGAGRYDLHAAAARKTGEYRDGIGRLWDSRAEGLDDYLAAVRAVNRGKTLRFYPGSPRIARFFLRTQDRMRLCEGESSACERLRAEFAGDTQVQVRCGDGYAALKAWLPPPERRGLVLIDPPYESGDEWRRAPDAIASAVARWQSGIYAIWYPLKVGAPVRRLREALVGTELRSMLSVELRIWQDETPFRLNGCGLLVVNPPWHLEEALGKLRKPLTERLKQGPGAPRVHLEQLAPDTAPTRR